MQVHAVRAPSQAKGGEPAKIAAAAKDFEALLISELLKSFQASASGWLGGEEDSAAESAMGLAQEQLAQDIARRGGLGLAQTITDGLLPHQASTKAKGGHRSLTVAAP